MIAEVVPAANLPRDVASFWSYRIPDNFGELKTGDVVKIPFRKKELSGVVSSVKTGSETQFKLKDISDIVPDLRLTPLQLEIARFTSRFYFAPLGMVLKLLLPAVPKRCARTELRLDGARDIKRCPDDISGRILADTEKYDKTLLLHSLASERHSLYLEMIQRQEEGSQTLLMLPEYFDIWSIARTYIERLGKNNVAILSSDITKNQYFSQWQKVKDGTAKLIIGTRQSVYAPFKKLGLVIVDEEHNSSYKQWDQNPRYHGVRVALELARLHSAKTMLASPTPSPESYRLCQGDFHLIDVSERPSRIPEIIDMETERKGGNHTFVSEKLKEELLKKIYDKKQALICVPLLGEKTAYQCRDCGLLSECPDCHNALIGYRGKLYCPRCKKSYEIPRQCPKCSGQNIGSFGGGSDRVAEEIRAIFENKNINIVKLDSADDTAADSQKIFSDFQQGRIDILVGTQMVWKNWQMENLALVSVIFPEIIFNAPGFRSRERARQFLVRAYSFARDAQVILETHKPEHKYLTEMKKMEAVDFLEGELEGRGSAPSLIKYPPFGRLIKLIYKDPSATDCEREARAQYAALRDTLFRSVAADEMEVLPPFAAHNYREAGKYRWHIILRHKPEMEIGKRNGILETIKSVWIVDIDPDEIL